jgi:beta-mannosidase
MPALRTVEYWMGVKKDDASERRPQGRLMAQHCKAGAHQKRFAVLMNENLRLTDDLETCVSFRSDGGGC